MSTSPPASFFLFISLAAYEEACGKIYGNNTAPEIEILVSDPNAFMAWLKAKSEQKSIPDISLPKGEKPQPFRFALIQPLGHKVNSVLEVTLLGCSINLQLIPTILLAGHVPRTCMIFESAHMKLKTE